MVKRKRTAKRQVRFRTTPEDQIAAAFEQAELWFQREYMFHPTRKWRADFLVLAKPIGIVFDTADAILVEYEGGVWSRGRHTRGAGYAADCVKYREATKLGFRVMRYTSDDLKRMGAAGIAQEIKEMIG